MDSDLFNIQEEDIINLVEIENALCLFSIRPVINVDILWKHHAHLSKERLSNYSFLQTILATQSEETKLLHVVCEGYTPIVFL